jgi:hypothetical protein
MAQRVASGVEDISPSSKDDQQHDLVNPFPEYPEPTEAADFDQTVDMWQFQPPVPLTQAVCPIVS